MTIQQTGILTVKRGTGSSVLADGELGWNPSTLQLYIGEASVNRLIAGSGAASHILLDGAVVTDTINTAVVRGSIVVGNSTPKWTAVTAGTSGQLLQMNTSDPGWVTMSGDATLAAGGAVTVTRINGATLGTTTATSGRILVADGSQWVSVAMSGDATITSAGAITVSQGSTSFALTADITPAQITSQQNNYNPAGLSTASVLRLSTDLPWNITGLAGGSDGRIIIIYNVGTQNFTIKDESTSSTAANRFALTADITMLPDSCQAFQYDSTSSRWRPISLTTSSPVGSTALLAGQIFVGSASNLVAAVSMSGDVTISSAGATTVSRIAGSLLGTTTATSGNLLIADGSQWNTTAMSGDATINSSGALMVSAAAITYAKFQNVAALSVVGRSANSSGVSAAISATAGTGYPLRESGSTIGFGTITSAAISDFDAQVRTSRLDQMAAPTAAVSMNSNRITNVTDPSSAQDAATKAYVDSVAQGLSFKPTAQCATTTTLPAYSYAAGVITFSATGTETIDGHLTAVNERVLVKDETGGNAPYNGLYKITTAGAVGVAGVWTRDTAMDVSSEFGGAVVGVENGTVNAETMWVCTTDSPTVGTTNIAFSELKAPTSYSGSTYIDITGTTISLKAHAATHQNGGSDEIATATSGANAIPKAGAGGTLAIGWIPTGSSSSTVCIGNDSRLSDARTPVGTALTSANLWVGNGSNVAAAVAMSGHVTINNTGATTLAASIGQAETFLLTNATTAAADAVLTLGHNSSGTPAAGFGLIEKFQLASSTTNAQDAGDITVTWATATHASRKARVVFNVYDTAIREAIRIEGLGSAAGFSVFGAAAAGVQTGDVGTALVTFGFMSGTPTFAAANLTGTTLAASVVTSSLTAVGTIATGVWQGTIITSAYGGTGNGFTKFSGPATTEKTFTLPNASATILTDNAAVTVAQGGTGRASTTAYAVICGGTTSTNPEQSIASVGTSGQVLTSNGAGALPTFQAPTGGVSLGKVLALHLGLAMP